MASGCSSLVYEARVRVYPGQQEAQDAVVKEGMG
jgi:hypothetical protein